jgi:uncharacterized protein (DUF427 family)
MSAQPRTAGHQIEILESAHHLRIEIDGELVAESHEPRVLTETGLPPRYYLPREDVRATLIGPTETQTRCPFKGVASYWSIQVGDRTCNDVVWSYEDPIPAAAAIRGLVAFFNEKVDITVDGRSEERPRTRWSTVG